MSTTKFNMLYKHANFVAIPKIGLEVHAQLNIKSKLFSQGLNLSQGKSNTHLDLLDIALPGTLPKLNKNALDAAILSSIGLNCKVQNYTHFDRKNYFYTDMPSGYQITQYNNPIAKNGHIDFIVRAHHKSTIAHSQRYDVVKYLYGDDRKAADELQPYFKRSIIKQIQLEQDSAKTLIHTTNDLNQYELCHLIDYNRCGAGLIEIVFEPDLTNHYEASSLIKELITILKSLNTCDCELQEGSLRVDANVSIRNFANEEINSARVELKNLNSLKSLSKGILFEIQRQTDILSKGQKIVQETRTYDTKRNETILLRIKEEAVDYRYIPEPSIPPIYINQSLIDDAMKKLPKEMSADIRKKLIDDFNLEFDLITEIMEEPGLSNYLFQIMKNKGSTYDANVVADFLIYAVSNLKDIPTASIEVDLIDMTSEFMERLGPEKMQIVFDLMFSDEISFATAYELIKYIYVNNDKANPKDIVSRFDWFQINDKDRVVDLCNDLIAKMKNISKKYKKKGDKKHLRFMLDKLFEVNDNKISIKLAIKTIDEILKPPKSVE